MRVLILWRLGILVVVFLVMVWHHAAWGADDAIDVGTVTAIATGVGTALAAVAAGFWRFMAGRQPPAPPPVTADSPTLPPQKVPKNTTLLRKEIKQEELLRRLQDLLPKLERVDWDALDDLGRTLAHIEQEIKDAHRHRE